MPTIALRRGLPRRPGEEPWPPADAAVEVPESVAGAAVPAQEAAPAPETTPTTEAAPAQERGSTEATAAQDTVPAGSGVQDTGEQPAEPPVAHAVDGAPSPAPAPTGSGSTSGPGSSTDSDSASGAARPTTSPASAGFRRGLPRVAGGDAWPSAEVAAAAGAVAGTTAGAATTAQTSAPSGTEASPAVAPDAGEGHVPDAGTDAPGGEEARRSQAVAPGTTGGAAATAAAAGTTGASAPDAAPAVAGTDSASAEGASAGGTTAEGVGVRRGLPRVAGGEPWPAADVTVPAGAAVAAGAAAAATTGTDGPQAQPTAETTPEAAGATTGAQAGEDAAAGSPAPAGTSAPEPRVEKEQASGHAPADSTAPASSGKTAAPTARSPERSASQASQEPAPTAASKPASKPAPTPAGDRAATKPAASSAGEAAAERNEPRRVGPFTVKQWAGVGLVGVLAIIGALTVVSSLARWFMGLEFMQEFLATYPGAGPLPENAPVGIPGWLGWQHFFNIFLMVLIIRTGITIHHETKPPAFWTPRKGGKKISLTIWLHQALDVLWLLNGLVFVVLLFATGQWMRIVPTDWAVIPNAVSAGLHYLSLDWPTENGWVSYNALQQLAYFTTVFIAAPVSALTGWRMSTFWPAENKALNKAFPAELARKLHFPTMIYFVAFIVIHVALVLTTGALRNLSTMFAARGDVDPSVYAGSWVGFWIFVGAMVVIAAAWVAMRPLVVAPVARLFGQVSSR